MKKNKPLDYNYARNVIDYTKATKSFKERNDCSVRAIATAVGVEYNEAHMYLREKFERIPRKGCQNMVGKILRLIKNDPVQRIGDREFQFEYVQRKDLKNRYKVHGKVINRRKTVKSFINTFREGTYLVFVSNHVFTVKDGCLIDNSGEEFRPTRKVLDAVRVNVRSNQMDFFEEGCPLAEFIFKHSMSLSA